MKAAAGILSVVLCVAAPSRVEAQRAAQLLDDEVYIVNMASSRVQFSLRPLEGTWAVHALESQQNNVYRSAKWFEIEITTELSGSDKKTVNYTLTGGNRYAIYQNGSYFDVNHIGVDVAAEAPPRGSEDLDRLLRSHAPVRARSMAAHSSSPWR